MSSSDILLILWRGGSLEECLNRAKRFPDDRFWLLHDRDGLASFPAMATVEQIVEEGLVKSAGKNRTDRRWYSLELTDDGLRAIGKPTKAEAMKVEVSGPDVRRRHR